MKSAVETLEPTRVKLTVEVSYDELKPSLDAAYKQIATQVTIPGFRKGKVPPRIIDQRVGRAAVIEQAVNEALPGFYRQAVTEADIRPLGQPDVEVTGVPDVHSASGDLTFTAEVDVRPEITFPDLAGLTLTVDDVAVTDADIDERIEALRARFGTLIGVDRPAETGDFVVLDLTAVIEGDEVDSVSGVSYELGTGNMLEGLDEALVGLSAGETTTFIAPLAGGDHAGEGAEITVTPTAVKERELPEADDDFAELASEFDTIAELRADLSRQVATGKISDQVGQAREALVAALLADVDFQVPAGVVEAKIHRHLEEEGRLEDDEHREEVRGEATEALRSQLLLDALADKLAVAVSQNELVEFLLRTAQQYGIEANEFISSADKAGEIPAFVSELARNKALALALREVTVVDTSGNAVDLTAFIGSAESDAAMAQAQQIALSDELDDDAPDDIELQDDELQDDELRDDELQGA